MNRNFTLQNTSLPEVATIQPVPEGARALLRFPGDDGGESLTAMAQRDFDAALQLLAERAQYITGAAGAAIALRDAAGMICRASVGDCAPALGLRVQIDSGLSGESVRTRQILRCDNADNDARVNRESCRALGIASVVVMPLVTSDEVSGLFELFSAKPYAFEERDIVALQRLSEMVQTAIQRAQAVELTEQELRLKSPGETDHPSVAVNAGPGAPAGEDVKAPQLREIEAQPSTTAALPTANTESLSAEDDSPIVVTERGNIGKCSSCGFPVSQGRELCVDCEKARGTDAPVEISSGFLAEVGQTSDAGWLGSHKYELIALAVIVLLVAVILSLR